MLPFLSQIAIQISQKKILMMYLIALMLMLIKKIKFKPATKNITTY